MNKNRIIKIAPRGIIKIDDVFNCFRVLESDICSTKRAIIIVDLNKIENYSFNSDEAMVIPRFYSSLTKKIKGAILVGKDTLHFGIARMIQNIYDIHNMGPLFIVSDHKEAKKTINRNFSKNSR